MDCHELADDVLLDLAEGRLPRPERALAQRHLEGCGACRDRHDELDVLARGLRRSLEAPSSPALLAELDRSVLGALATEWAPRRTRPRRAAWGHVVVAASALFVVSVLLRPDGAGVPVPPPVLAPAAPAPVALSELTVDRPSGDGPVLVSYDPERVEVLGRGDEALPGEVDCLNPACPGSLLLRGPWPVRLQIRGTGPVSAEARDAHDPSLPAADPVRLDFGR